MKVMYIAPRFHTNQSDVVKGWLKSGNEVIFISYYTSIIEDYSELKPIVLGFSPLYNIFDKFYVKILHRNDVNANGFKIKHGFPPIKKLRRIIREWKPDIIILRDRTLYTIAGYLLGKRNSKCILYDQNPMWDDPPKKDWMHKIVYRITPEYRMTPVMGKETAGKMISDHSYFLPFVVEPKIAPQNKKYFYKDRINVLCVGVYTPRKHHMMLIDAMHEITQILPDRVHLTIIGEATEKMQKEHLQRVKEHIRENGYGGLVTLMTNIPKAQMEKYFAGADVFVLPSTAEWASISQMEAMSYSVPVICSDTNGTACYVINDENGYQFQDCSQEDLKKKLLMLLDSREKIVKMGKKAYQSIVDNNSFQKYYEGICRILKDYDEQ